MEEAIDTEKLIAWLLEKIFTSPKMKKELPGDKLAADAITYEHKNKDVSGPKRFAITYCGSEGDDTLAFAVPDGIRIENYLEYICAALDTHLKMTLINQECKVKATFKNNNDKKGSERIIITFNYV